MKYKLRFYLSKAPSLANFIKLFIELCACWETKWLHKKRAQDFYKSDTLVPTNQTKYDCFFSQETQNTKKLFSEDIQAKKNRSEKNLKKSLVKLEISTELFLSPENHDW